MMYSGRICAVVVHYKFACSTRVHYDVCLKSLCLVGKAITEAGIDAKPTDYLNMFCLGTREGADVPEDLDALDDDSPLQVYRERRRFQVYVHSKMMIVDDSYALVG